MSLASRQNHWNVESLGTRQSIGRVVRASWRLFCRLVRCVTLAESFDVMDARRYLWINALANGALQDSRTRMLARRALLSAALSDASGAWKSPAAE